MIYNTRNWSTTESHRKKKKTCFNAHFESCIFLEKDVVIRKLSYVKVGE